MTHVFIEHQPTDKSYAVYVGGDGDPEGVHDALFTYGLVEDRRIRRGDARNAALTAGRQLAHKLGDGFTVLE